LDVCTTDSPVPAQNGQSVVFISSFVKKQCNLIRAGMISMEMVMLCIRHSNKNKFKFGSERWSPSFGFTYGEACAMVPEDQKKHCLLHPKKSGSMLVFLL